MIACFIAQNAWRKTTACPLAIRKYVTSKSLNFASQRLNTTLGRVLNSPHTAFHGTLIVGGAQQSYYSYEEFSTANTFLHFSSTVPQAHRQWKKPRA